MSDIHERLRWANAKAISQVQRLGVGPDTSDFNRVPDFAASEVLKKEISIYACIWRSAVP